MTTTELEWNSPGPGAWTLDAEHCQRPRSRYTIPLVEGVYSSGMAAGFARYGCLLETIDCAFVNGFPYVSPRPVGLKRERMGRASTSAPPPRLIFKAMCWLHPGLRGRLRRCPEVWEGRLWREDLRQSVEALASFQARLGQIQAAAPAELDDAALVGHLEGLYELGTAIMYDHFSGFTATMLPVGDFACSVDAWTGCGAGAALGALRGGSPHSLSFVTGAGPLRDALDSDGEAAAALGSDDDPEEILRRLLSWPGEVGRCCRAWIDEYGDWIVTGHDVTDLRAIELPGLLVSALRELGERRAGDDPDEDSDEALRDLRAKVPTSQQASFDALLEEARAAYAMRDAHSVVDYRALGLMRRGLLEAGERLVDRGLLARRDHTADLAPPELAALLRGEAGAAYANLADEAAARAHWRETTTSADVPQTLGAGAAPPPPDDWLPEHAARLQRAISFYVGHLFADADADEGEGAPRKDDRLRGIAASPGRYVGVARHVRAPKDFERVRKGDVLVASITTPTYNVLLPIIGAVVTDRGGMLSHPAIVAREFGLPGVVGTRRATTVIPDGATVEVDGTNGHVRVLS